MRLRLALLGVLASLVLPASAAAFERSQGDGSLSVKGAGGTVSLAVRGSVIGQIDHGRVTIQDPNPADGKQPVVTGYEERRDVNDTKALYSGTDIRFRIIGGFFRVKLVGTGIDLSVVGRGSVTLGPALGVLTTGTFSFDGDEPLPFPDVALAFQLGSSSSG